MSNASRDDDDHSLLGPCDAPGDEEVDESDEMEAVVACEDAVEDEAVEEVVEVVVEVVEVVVDVVVDGVEEEEEGGEAMGGRAMPIRERERRETVLVKSLLPIQTRMKRAQATRMIRMTKETS